MTIRIPVISRFSCLKKENILNQEENILIFVTKTLNNEVDIIPVTYNPFKHAELESVVELIEPQKELLLSCMIGGDDANLAYNESVSLTLAGDVKIEAV